MVFVDESHFWGTNETEIVSLLKLSTILSTSNRQSVVSCCEEKNEICSVEKPQLPRCVKVRGRLQHQIETSLEPQNHEKWRFYTPQIWVITPKYEGLGGPWLLIYVCVTPTLELTFHLKRDGSSPKENSLPTSLFTGYAMLVFTGTNIKHHILLVQYIRCI